MRARQKELRDRVLLSESGVSRLLVRMEKAGVITRSVADDDRRGMEIAVTEAGQAALLAAIDELKVDMHNRRTAYTDEINQVKARLGSSTTTPTQGAPSGRRVIDFTQ
jgi:DNA-binding MarR family transcriptional regulator